MKKSLLLFILLLSVVFNVSAQEFEDYTPPNPRVICLEHLNELEIYTIPAGKKIVVIYGSKELKLKGKVQEVTEDSILIDNTSVSLKDINRIKIPTPGRKVLAIASAIPGTLIALALTVLAFSNPDFIVLDLFFGFELSALLGANYMGSYSLAMKWFETTYQWKVSSYTLQDLKLKYGDRLDAKQIN